MASSGRAVKDWRCVMNKRIGLSYKAAACVPVRAPTIATLDPGIPFCDKLILLVVSRECGI